MIFSKYNEELGFAASYLVNTVGTPEEIMKDKTPAKKSSKKSAFKDVTESGKQVSISGEDKRRKSSAGEPKWQIGVERPKLL